MSSQATMAPAVILIDREWEENENITEDERLWLLANKTVFFIMF